MNQELILTADSRKKFVQTLNQLHSEMIDVDKLMDIAFSIKAFSRKHILEMREAARKQLSGCNEEDTKTWNNSLLSLFGHMNL